MAIRILWFVLTYSQFILITKTETDNIKLRERDNHPIRQEAENDDIEGENYYSIYILDVPMLF